MQRTILFLLAIALITMTAHTQSRSQARSMVVSRGGIVAAESPLAAQAGAMILAHGGNAIDAAVATNAAMGVLEPMMNGIGGDLFAIVYEAKTERLYGLNASGWAPAKLTLEFIKSEGITEMPREGIHSVTVPGAVDGWSKLLSRFGSKKFPEVLAPAIHFAKDGFPVPELDAEYWGVEREKVAGRSQRRGNISDRRPRAAPGRNISRPGSGALSGANCRRWPRRILQRRNRSSHRSHILKARRHDDA